MKIHAGAILCNSVGEANPFARVAAVQRFGGSRAACNTSAVIALPTKAGSVSGLELSWKNPGYRYKNGCLLFTL